MKTATPAIRITQRDIEVIVMVHSYNGVFVSHIQKKFWPDALSHTAYYRRLSMLIEAGYLKINNKDSLDISSRMFLTVGASSIPLLSEWLGVSPSQLEKPTRAVSPFIVAHRAAVADVRLSLELAWQSKPWARAFEWQSEGDLARAPATVTYSTTIAGQPQTIKRQILPDGAFSIPTNTNLFKAFVEVDMGTIPHRLSEKLKDYLVYEKDLKTKIPVLFIVTENFRMQSDRVATIIKWAEEEARKLTLPAGIFYVAKKTSISQESILTDTIWQVAGAGRELQKLPIVYTAIALPVGQIQAPGYAL